MNLELQRPLTPWANKAFRKVISMPVFFPRIRDIV
jgi:hypothetical protein